VTPFLKLGEEACTNVHQEVTNFFDNFAVLLGRRDSKATYGTQEPDCAEIN